MTLSLNEFLEKNIKITFHETNITEQGFIKIKTFDYVKDITKIKKKKKRRLKIFQNKHLIRFQYLKYTTTPKAIT